MRWQSGVVLDFCGGTLEQYDQVMVKMGLTVGADPPEGSLFHWVAKHDDGIRVTDVWGSRETFDRFAQEKIGPITLEVASPGCPTPTSTKSTTT